MCSLMRSKTLVLFMSSSSLRGPLFKGYPQLTSSLQSYAAGLPIDHIPEACFPSQNNIHLVEFALHAIDSNKLFNRCF